MKEKILKWKETLTSWWTKRTKSQKFIFFGSIFFVIILVAGLIFFTSGKTFVPLYNNLSIQEVGQIKTELDARGIEYELQDGGTTILVPEVQVDSLLVDLAGQGIPDSGNIDYSFFSENASWGVTENEFNMMKLDAMQTELSNMIGKIDGIEDAKVMINMPEEPVFVDENSQTASASIVLQTKPGYDFKNNQIESLYHLVSKAVPNLPAENIVIMDQYSNYFDRDAQATQGSQDTYTYQQSVKKDIEKDIQRRMQQMLGAMVGMENVIVSVTSDVDFTQEQRTENIVEPVDLENMEGLPVSVETIKETYSGNPPVGGTTGTGEEDIPNYPAADEDGNGDYEMTKETVNNEFSRIQKDIVESPYKIRDLGIQVAVNNKKDTNGKEIQLLTQQEQTAVEQGISSILNSIVSTSISKEYGEINPEEKVSIIFQEFNGKPSLPDSKVSAIPKWLYITGAALLIIIILLAILLFRKRNNEEEEEIEEDVTEEKVTTIPEMPDNEQSEAVIRRKQLEKIAKEKPEDFAKLLRSWIGED